MTTLELEARLDNLLSTAQEETKDIYIFAPIPEREECPICMIQLPINDKEITLMSCCGKKICSGCIHQNIKADVKNGVPDHEQKCAFCRRPPGNSIKEKKRLMKKKNPEAFMDMSHRYEAGDGVFQSDTKALELRICAAELGYADAFGSIGYHYSLGTAVVQDISKALDFWAVAAKKGSIYAHNLLSNFHRSNGNQESINHLKVAASAGHQQSMDDLMKAFKDKLLSKEELSQTLRAYQASHDKTKSKERDYSRAIRVRYG